MSPNPQSFLTHLQQKGYNPRSNKHSNALAEAIVADLLAGCPAMRRDAALGKLVYSVNFTLSAGTSDWNVDLVLGVPAAGTSKPGGAAAIARIAPSRVRVAIEIKSIMTEHRKAVKNRKRDLEAHHSHVHAYDQKAIAAGVLVVNQAGRFKSTLRAETTAHQDPVALVEHCMREMRAVATRTSARGEGMDAKAVLVVDMDNIDLNSTRYVARSPAPQVGSPLHYDAFLQTICDLYAQRFG